MIVFDPPFGTPFTFTAAGCLALIALTWSLRYLEQGRLSRLRAFADQGALDRLVKGYRPALRRPLNALILLGALFLTLALAGPQWGAKEAGRPERFWSCWIRQKV